MKNKSVSVIVEYILLVIAVVFFLWVNLSYEIQTNYQLLFSVCLLMTFIGLYWFIPRPLNTLLFLLLSSIYYVYVLAQNVYYSAFGQYFRLSMLVSMKDEIGDSTESIMEFIKPEYFYPLIVILLVSIASLLLYLFSRKTELKYKFRIPVFLLCFVIAFSSYAFAKNRIEKSKESEDTFMVYKTDYYVYTSIPSTTQFSNEFGFSGLLVRDLESFFQKSQLVSSYQTEIEEYMNSRKPYTENRMTGLFEGKSLLMIQAESLMNIAIDKELTPTLYKMMNDGIYIQGYSSPLMDGSTSSTEFMANLSLYPLNDDGYNPSLKFMNNTYKTTLPKMFSSEGYKSYAFHNNYGEFYSRNIIMPNYGYNFFDSLALGLESESADSVYLEIAKWILLEKEQFFAYWITYNGHQPYNLEQKPEIAQYISQVQEKYPELREDYVSYLAKTIDMDHAIEAFLQNAADAGKAEDVVIVIFGDHYAKGLVDDTDVADALNAMGLPSDEDSVYFATATPLIFYSPSLSESMKYEKTSNTIDILPTIANLWGFEIDEKTVLGNDIFDEDYDGFYFNVTETYKTDLFRYDFIQGKVVSVTEEITEQQALEEVNEIIQRFEISKYILEMDFFKVDE